MAGWLIAEARIAEAPVAEASTFSDESVRNKLMSELIGADGAPGIISGNEAFFNGRPVPTEDELKKMPLSSLQNLVVDLNVYKNLNHDTRSGAGTNVSGAASAGEASA